MAAKGGDVAKAPEAFRTISEAADLLDTPAHVLRFWESKFPQVKPVKRAGGRRYYRRVDIDLLSGIKLLLHDQGMTIRGVQKLLQDKGPRHVAELAPLPDDVLDDDLPLADLVIEAVAESVLATALPPEGPPLAASLPVMAEPAPPAPPLLDGELNVFARIRAPIVPPAPAPIQPARLAHALRSVRQSLEPSAELGRIAQRLEALIARMAALESDEYAR
jgi:DNA-binding transcriptional MerR regulator